MYRLTYGNDEVRQQFSEKKAFWDPELERELRPVLEMLKATGEVEGTSCGVNLIAPGQLYYELAGYNFSIGFTVNADRQEICFYEFQPRSHELDWKAALDQDLSDGEEEKIYIPPQIGDPHKFIKAVQCIGQGTNTSKALGIAFKSKAKADKDIGRRGDYLGLPLLELGLAYREPNPNGVGSVYLLTSRGQHIAQSPDAETRERLLVEALLGYYPIQVLIAETTKGQKELTKALIEETIDIVSMGDCGGLTRPRRASSLRALTNWVTRWAGIPIRREGTDGVQQLYIPFIYETTTI